MHLDHIEVESAHDGLEFNTGKWSYLASNCRGNLSDPNGEIRKRISETMGTLKRLDIFWLKGECNKRWKRLVYNAASMGEHQANRPYTATNLMNRVIHQRKHQPCKALAKALQVRTPSQCEHRDVKGDIPSYLV